MSGAQANHGRTSTMKPAVKRVIQRGLRRFGYELRRVSPMQTVGSQASPPDGWPWPWIRATRTIGTVIDIGASDGAFADFLARYFQPSHTYVFEPRPACLSALRALAHRLPNLHVFNMALASGTGTATLYENSYGPATSLLPVGEVTRREFPEVGSERATLVEVARLDDVIDTGQLTRDILVKIDVQGAEAEVIRGGHAVFGASACVLIEMSFVPMYSGQALFEEVHGMLTRLGLRLAGVKDQVCSTSSGQPMFAHCVYVR